MGNIITYVKKTKNIEFNEEPFNDVDALILCQLVYLNLDEYVPSLDENKDSVIFSKIINKISIKKMCKKIIDERRLKRLLKHFKTNNRYKNLKINYIQNIFLTEEVEQFYAVTYELEDFVFVCFSGTDARLIGWYEDFNMAVLDKIPAQNSASIYLEEVSKKTNKKMIIGGHSKGGNLAVYASVYSDLSIKERIIKIYDFDGPGFNKNIFELQEYKDIEDKIIKMTCHGAMIGVLLYHSEKMLFVKARSVSIFQHDLFNWKIRKNKQLKFVKKANLKSRVFKKTVKEFIEQTNEEERKKIIDLIFYIIMSHKEATLFDVVRRPISYTHGIRKRYKKLIKEDRKLLTNSLKRYIEIYNRNLLNAIRRKDTFKKINNEIN